MTDEKLNDLFDRLRETEAQTREQQVRINALTDKLESFSSLADKFILEIHEQEKRSEDREKSFLKVIYVMLGTIVSLALGPKVAKEIISAQAAGKIPLASSINPIAPMTDNRDFIFYV